MTTARTAPAHHFDPDIDPDPEPDLDALSTVQPLRNVLRLNAVSSAATGLALLVAAGPVGDLVGIDHTMALRLVGLGLLVFAGEVGAAAGARLRRLVRLTPAIVAADVVWVIATVATLVAGWFTGAGVVLVGAVGLVVGLLASRQWVHWRRVRSFLVEQAGRLDQAPPLEIVVLRTPLPAPADVGWSVITDHDLYARLAPNLSGIEVLGGNGPGLVRTCANRKGEAWSEHCTLWDEGRRFDVEIETDGYPYPLQLMRGSWAVEPDGTDRSVAVMRFVFRPRPGVWGRLFAAAMHTAFKPILQRIARGWRREARLRRA